jgi:hypothetical protein
MQRKPQEIRHLQPFKAEDHLLIPLRQRTPHSLTAGLLQHFLVRVVFLREVIAASLFDAVTSLDVRTSLDVVSSDDLRMEYFA